MSERYACDCCWGAKLWFQSKDAEADASDRLISEAQKVESYLMQFVKRPGFYKIAAKNRSATGQRLTQVTCKQPEGKIAPAKACTADAWHSLRNAPAGKRRRYGACALVQPFRSWLVCKQSFTEGSAKDYGWSLTAENSDRRKVQACKAWPLLEQFLTTAAGRRSAEKACGSFALPRDATQKKLCRQARPSVILPLQRRKTIDEQRVEANASARAILAKVKQEDGKVCDADIVRVFKQWAFSNNARESLRPNASPKQLGSETFGAVRCRQGRWHLTPVTMKYPEVPRLLNAWIQGQEFSNLAEAFVYTTLVVNSNWQCKLHRDSKNEGPSIVKSFNSSGGYLRYYHMDDGSQGLKQIVHQRSEDLDVHAHTVLLDGNRGHEVLPFEGDRLSMVAFTRQGFMQSAPAEFARKLKGMHFHLPTPLAMTRLKALLWRRPYLKLTRKRKLQ